MQLWSFRSLCLTYYAPEQAEVMKRHPWGSGDEEGVLILSPVCYTVAVVNY